MSTETYQLDAQRAREEMFSDMSLASMQWFLEGHFVIEGLRRYRDGSLSIIEREARFRFYNPGVHIEPVEEYMELADRLASLPRLKYNPYQDN